MQTVFTHLSQKETVSVKKSNSARNDFVISFGPHSKVFVTAEHIILLKKEIAKYDSEKEI
ncbi:MAG: hypothetical protein K0B02_03875 [DPANN group archaeon]|nr:hypothetical protein [DPANN group archaeon]